MSVVASRVTPRTVRWALLRACGFTVRTRAISHGCEFFTSNVTIERGCFVNYGCEFDASADIVLEARVHLGPGVQLLTGSHRIEESEQRAGELYARPIRVREGVWLGARVQVLPGVTVGRGTVVAAGSVVTESCLPNALYAGSPAQYVRALSS